jgi:omega-6 fatty acid desaturase (delta-12 desaturase)
MENEKRLIVQTIPFTKENRSKSWTLTISSIVFLASSLILVLLNTHWVINLLMSTISGLLIVRVFTIYHDYLHEAILRESKLAKLIFTIFGLYILSPIAVWKRSHNYHHNNNSKLFRSGIGSYPVFTKDRFEQLSKKQQRVYLFIRHPLVIILGYFFTFLFGMCIQPLIKSFRRHIDSLIALIFHFSFHMYIFYTFGAITFIWFSLIPHVISGGLGAYLFYAQHNFPGVHYNVDENWTYEGAALESSSYMKTNAITHWFTGNIGYHHVHHLNSRIPFYRLPEAMKSIEGLQKPVCTSLRISDILTCFRLKLWDTKSKKMVSLK